MTSKIESESLDLDSAIARSANKPPVHVVVGAGAIGSALVRQLGELGHHVKLVTRSGSGPLAMGQSSASGSSTDLAIETVGGVVETIALDATNASELAKIASGAVAIYNCANPRYSQWATAWPPLAASLLSAAETTGAVLVTMSNLYGYADPTEPMTEDSPLAPSSKKGQIRVDMWMAAKASHDAGRSRVVEVRASDFIGAQVGENGHIGDRVVPNVLKGKGVMIVGDPTHLHSWTATEDVARALITVATEPAAWGKAWHVPTAQPVSAAELVARMSQLAGKDPIKVGSIPNLVLGLLGLFNKDVKALKEMRYQFDRPFVIDSSAFTKEFGWDHRPLDETLLEVLDAYGEKK